MRTSPARCGYRESRGRSLPNAQTSPWTTESIAILKRLWLSGESATRIAVQLGHPFNKNKVIGKAHRLHLPAHDNARNSGWKPGVHKPRVRKRRIYANRTPKITKPEPVVTMQLRSPPQLPPKPLPIMPAEPLAAPPVNLLDLQAHHCRYMVSPSRGPASLFCGATIATGSLCARHHAICYAPVRQRDAA